MLWESSTGSCLWVRLRIITNATLFVVRRRWDDSTQSLGRWSRFSVGVLSSPSLIFSCFVDFHCTRNLYGRHSQRSRCGCGLRSISLFLGCPSSSLRFHAILSSLESSVLSLTLYIYTPRTPLESSGAVTYPRNGILRNLCSKLDTHFYCAYAVKTISTTYWWLGSSQS
jgi:hypothetical protein